MAVPWKYKLKIADVFHNDEMSLEEKRDTIVGRITAAPFYDESNEYLVTLVEELAEADTEDWFNACWNDFYDPAHGMMGP